ncbi:MAG: hypothetical protein ACJAYB_000019 [Psychromonas sp.]|jgi:hypothetical protein
MNDHISTINTINELNGKLLDRIKKLKPTGWRVGFTNRNSCFGGITIDLIDCNGNVLGWVKYFRNPDAHDCKFIDNAISKVKKQNQQQEKAGDHITSIESTNESHIAWRRETCVRLMCSIIQKTDLPLDECANQAVIAMSILDKGASNLPSGELL